MQQQPGIDNKLRQTLADSLGATSVPILTKQKSERGSASIRHSLKTGIANTHSSSSAVGDDAPISSPISSNLSNGGIGNS
jgi:hypothetical protein